MDNNSISVIFLFFLFVSDAANASMSWRSRKLVDGAAKDNSTTIQNSPFASPVSDGKQLDPKPAGPVKSNESSSESQAPNNSYPNGRKKSDPLSPLPQAQANNETNNSQKSDRRDSVSPPPKKQVDSKEKKESNKTKPLNPPPPNKAENEKNNKESGKTDPSSPLPAKVPDERNDKGNTQTGSSETCSGVSNRCRDEKTLVACTLSARSGTGEWSILVQNEGEESLKVKVVLPDSVKNPLKELSIPKHGSERVNITIDGDVNKKIIFNAGQGECVLHMDPLVSEGSIFFYLPSYEKLVTPINGAYFLIFSVVVLGGTWACCLCRKRKRQDGIAYKELEMGETEGRSVNDGDTAEGWDEDWDEGWDCTWDEENAVKSPGGRDVRNVSANGLTVRSSNRDGWENDWDD